MNYRSLGRTGWRISEISFGAWAIGGAWGSVDDEESLATLHAALDGGVDFFDTADVYGDGRSERLLAKLKKRSTRSRVGDCEVFWGLRSEVKRAGGRALSLSSRPPAAKGSLPLRSGLPWFIRSDLRQHAG
jgi:hypothetical protein